MKKFLHNLFIYLLFSFSLFVSCIGLEGLESYRWINEIAPKVLENKLLIFNNFVCQLRLNAIENNKKEKEMKKIRNDEEKRPYNLIIWKNVYFARIWIWYADDGWSWKTKNKNKNPKRMNERVLFIHARTHYTQLYYYSEIINCV